MSKNIRLDWLKDAILKKSFFYLVVNSEKELKNATNFFKNKLNFNTLDDNIEDIIWDNNSLIVIDVLLDDNIITYRKFKKSVVLNEHYYKFFYNWDDDKNIILKAFNYKINYKPNKIVNEHSNYFTLKKLLDKKQSFFIIPRTVEDAYDAFKFLKKILKDDDDHTITLNYLSTYNFYNSDSYRIHVYYIFNNSDKKSFGYINANRDDILTDDNKDNILFFPDDKNVLYRLYVNNTSKYNPKIMINENNDNDNDNDNDILYAFDMDDTLVYSKRFEEYVKPLLIREYLSPEAIFNNKIEDIGVDIDKLNYENGRIYFNDPNNEYIIPYNSSWVRKKDRIYLIQPDSYFMTDESMPIGKYNDIVNLYNRVENKCIITARNERLRKQTIESLKQLKIKKPNEGLFMYPINSFSYVYEYKSNILLYLYSTGKYKEIHYFDDNIKLLKKIKSFLSNKNINIKYYKVTKNRYRMI